MVAIACTLWVLAAVCLLLLVPNMPGGLRATLPLLLLLPNRSCYYCRPRTAHSPAC